ncbi:hypothetical protein K144313037_p10430 (plasmid) [Clostridium tetani]|uniref:hypothetical protein n=1 Tax=Clostridium tetani TaxID=1513 RepID=UPI000E177AFB|nr:hypothetical protein [Clostridium tetani]SUY80142.1 Uncharacterised protein [Clostridium tetani]BDR71176.1 hypothetical protein K144313037_p10430 [Clostridium tetani]BDR79717.1 hypothetical protein K154307017_p10430 [Clostridium tetani]BDR85353.1 hypothetical protein K254310026_p10420 [Clostridium tetani]BEV20813.1 hypothetical protein K154301001_26680 [Clostridium tetani]
MKFFRKMNEKEEYINLKSIRVAYFYTVFFLFICVVRGNSDVEFFLFITQNLVLIFSERYFESKDKK